MDKRREENRRGREYLESLVGGGSLVIAILNGVGEELVGAVEVPVVLLGRGVVISAYPALY